MAIEALLKKGANAEAADETGMTALMIAATLVLEQLRIFHMPQGGSVTLGGMVPLILLAYLEGPVVGAVGGCLYGFLNMMQDPFILHPVQVLFDYPLPYMCMGLAGLLPAHRIASTALAFVARFACHFISGVVFFASYAPEGMNPAVYSIRLCTRWCSMRRISCRISSSALLY